MFAKLTNKIFIYQECGQATRNDRIVGGDVTEPNEYPWQAAILNKTDELNAVLCGGTLITEKWVITAAHCMK